MIGTYKIQYVQFAMKALLWRYCMAIFISIFMEAIKRLRPFYYELLLPCRRVLYFRPSLRHSCTMTLEISSFTLRFYKKLYWLELLSFTQLAFQVRLYYGHKYFTGINVQGDQISVQGTVARKLRIVNK